MWSYRGKFFPLLESKLIGSRENDVLLWSQIVGDVEGDLNHRLRGSDLEKEWLE